MLSSNGESFNGEEPSQEWIKNFLQKKSCKSSFWIQMKKGKRIRHMKKSNLVEEYRVDIFVFYNKGIEALSEHREPKSKKMRFGEIAPFRAKAIEMFTVCVKSYEEIDEKTLFSESEWHELRDIKDKASYELGCLFLNSNPERAYEYFNKIENSSAYPKLSDYLSKLREHDVNRDQFIKNRF